MSTEKITIRSLGPSAIEVLIRGHRLVLDQPIPENGTDQGPTPTELFVASLAACAVHYARAYLDRHGVHEVAAECRFETSDERPHRVTELDVALELPERLSDEQLGAAMRAAGHCTVHNSIVQPPLSRFEYRRVREPARIGAA